MKELKAADLHPFKWLKMEGQDRCKKVSIFLVEEGSQVTIRRKQLFFFKPRDTGRCQRQSWWTEIGENFPHLEPALDLCYLSNRRSMVGNGFAQVKKSRTFRLQSPKSHHSHHASSFHQVLAVSPKPPHVPLISALWCRNHHIHFTYEETELRGGHLLPKVALLG